MYNVYITSLSFKGEAKKKKNKNKERDNTASHSFSRFQMKKKTNGHSRKWARKLDARAHSFIAVSQQRK